MENVNALCETNNKQTICLKHINSDALRFVYGRYRQPTSVPGISLYETTNENDKGGDPGDSDESDRYDWTTRLNKFSEREFN